MKPNVKFIRIIGGQNDGETYKLNRPWKHDVKDVERIEADGERYKLDRIEADTAVFVYDGPIK